jgi:hypothetical protein
LVNDNGADASTGAVVLCLPRSHTDLRYGRATARRCNPAPCAPPSLPDDGRRSLPPESHSCSATPNRISRWKARRGLGRHAMSAQPRSCSATPNNCSPLGPSRGIAGSLGGDPFGHTEHSRGSPPSSSRIGPVELRDGPPSSCLSARRHPIYVIRRSGLPALVGGEGPSRGTSVSSPGSGTRTAGEGAISMDQSSKARTAERPIHRACLVAGCPCKADSTVPARHTSLVAAVARTGETVGRHRSPDPTWRFVGLPIA